MMGSDFSTGGKAARAQADELAAIGLELNRALIARDGDPVLSHLADFIRTERIFVSDEALDFLVAAIRDVRRGQSRDG